MRPFLLRLAAAAACAATAALDLPGGPEGCPVSQDHQDRDCHRLPAFTGAIDPLGERVPTPLTLAPIVEGWLSSCLRSDYSSRPGGSESLSFEAQVEVLAQKGEVDVLLPFPASPGAKSPVLSSSLLLAFFYQKGQTSIVVGADAGTGQGREQNPCLPSSLS